MLTSLNAAAAAYAGGMKPANTPEENRAALQAALDTGRNVHIPFGTYPITGPVDFKAAGQTVFGQGPFQTILRVSGAEDLFRGNGRSGVSVLDMSLRGGADLTGGFAISLDGTPSVGGTPVQAWGGDIRNVFMDQMWGGVFVRDVNAVTIFDLNMQNMRGLYGIRAEALVANHRVDVIRLTHVAYSANAEARAAGRGIGLSIDGCVHTINVHNMAMVEPYRGIEVVNTANLPFGSHPSFPFAHNIEIDFPTTEAVRIDAIDRARFTGCYFHGSRQGTNVVLGAGVKDAKFVGCNITGAAHNGLAFEGDTLDIVACEFDWCSQQVPANWDGIYLGHTAQNVRIVGGGARDTSARYGIFRANLDTWVQVSAADGHRGVVAARNW